MRRTRFMILAAFLLALSVSGPLRAQDAGTTRDPWALAHRLLHFDSDYALPPPTPIYNVGDSTEFWVSKGRDQTPSRITASLAASSSNLYLWVEQGLFYTPDKMQQVGQQIYQAYVYMRARSAFEGPINLPGIGPIINPKLDPASLYDVPDVDNDPHLFILYARDLGQDQVIYNYNDGLPEAIAPGGYSNQHELLVVNATALPTVPLDDGYYTTQIAEMIYNFLLQSRLPAQAPWLRQANAVLFTQDIDFPDIRPNATAAFLQDPNTSLIQPLSSAANPDATQGAQQLFSQYLIQRYGVGVVRSLLIEPGSGLAPLDAALADNHISDPVSGAPVTGVDAFSDFVMANLASLIVTTPFGDGRYSYDANTLPDVPPQATILRDQFDTTLDDQTVKQFGSQYIVLLSSRDAILNLHFQGEAASARLPLPADADPENHFYWSGSGSNQNTTLTRSFDLSDVDSAQLSFDSWYDLSRARSYAYVEVSTDEGQTWTILPATLSSENNRYGLAYGPGFTGRSNPEAPLPVAWGGLVFNNEDGMTVKDIVADGPASQSDLQVGDRIIGYDETPWPEAPDILGLLAEHKPGDTIDLFIDRDGEQLSIPLTLGEHPTRFIYPAALWEPQEVDLSDYAGQQIMLRFEYISQPGAADSGIAIDNIRLPEIDYSDDAEQAGDWTAEGWQQIDNQVDQRFLLQSLSTGPQANPTIRVRPLIGPDDAATEGEWTLHVGTGEVLALAVSGLTLDSEQPAHFNLTISEVK